MRWTWVFENISIVNGVWAKCSLFIPCPGTKYWDLMVQIVRIFTYSSLGWWRWVFANISIVNGVWAQWGSWSACSKTCYPGGTQSRVRRCKPPRHGGKTCPGKREMRRKCRTDSGPCPCKKHFSFGRICFPYWSRYIFSVNGAWTSWSSWSECSVTCDSGQRRRVRNCSNPKPIHGGEDCHGERTGTKHCIMEPCIVDGGWSAWSDFSACSVTCGVGMKYSTRICNNPRARNGGKECEGNSRYRTQCDTSPCKGKTPKYQHCHLSTLLTDLLLFL
jgi:hemicentin